MAQPIRILHLEDQPRDVTLIRSALELDGLDCQFKNVTTREAFTAALEEGGFDLILSDYALPNFDGLSALQLARERKPDVPFILVSGTLGEEAAIDGLRGGATDYVLKHRLTRLGPAVQRALNEAAERRGRARLEGQLRQAQKMEAIGQLAGGIAHDFNNLLTAILGYAGLARQRLRSGQPAERDVGEIESAATRAAALTRQLLAFSRQQMLQPTRLNLNDQLSGIEQLLRRLIGENIHLQMRRLPELWSTVADAGQIEQVIMNLAINGRDAMPEGGNLMLETFNVELDGHGVNGRIGMRPGRYVLLTVSDTGCGMSAETKERLFEPFFTTKEVGKGTGLGLSTVHGIVNQSGGFVEVYSEIGRGSTFKVYLPVAESADTTSSPLAPTSPRGGRETVLLVEDETAVRAVAAEALRLAGYTVLEASDGEQAIALCEREPRSFELVITDVVMPRMSGVDLIRALSAQHPDVKALYISGYTELAVVHQGVRAGEMAFLQKPFSPDALLRKVREVLDDPVRRAA